MTTGADVTRRALFGLGLGRALEGAGLEAGPAPAPAGAAAPPARRPAGAGEAEVSRLGPSLAGLADTVLRRLLPTRGGGELLVVAAGDGSPVVEAALAMGHRVTAVERDGPLREWGRERCPGAAWHEAAPEPGAFCAVLAWFGATYDDDPRALAAELRAAARPGGLIAITAWTASAMNVLRPGARPAGHRPEHWSRFETAYRHFFDLPDLDVEPLVGPGALEAALVLARAPGVRPAAPPPGGSPPLHIGFTGR